MSAKELREKIAELIGGTVAKYPTLESPLIEKFIDQKNKAAINYYIKWLRELEKTCKKEDKIADAERIRQTLNRKPFKM